MVIVVDSIPPPNSSWTMWPMFWSDNNRISSSLPDSKASFCIFSIMSTRSLSFSSVRVSYIKKNQNTLWLSCLWRQISIIRKFFQSSKVQVITVIYILSIRVCFHRFNYDFIFSFDIFPKTIKLLTSLFS